MDISNTIQYDRAHTVRLVHPVTLEDTGISFDVVSSDSEGVVKAARKFELAEYRKQVESKDKAEIDLIEYNDALGRVKLAASIVAWNWSGKGWDELPSDPVCTDENKAYLINHPRAIWVREQLALGCANIENFTQVKSPPARNTSKKK